MKKLIALVLALALVLAVAAASAVTITVPSGDGHTYEVYQIFRGDLSGDTLSNIVWGQNGTETEGTVVDKDTLDDIVALSSSTESERAAALAAYADFTSTPYIATLTNAATAQNVPTGYYLIKDKDNVALADGEEHTLYIVQVLKDFTIARKAGTTTSEKTTDDVNDSDSSVNAAAQNSSDYDIGDAVPYHLKATIAEDVVRYDEKYVLSFEDTLEKGKFSAISALTIKIGNVDISDSTKVAEFNSDDTKDYTITVTQEKAPVINDPEDANYNDDSVKDGFEIKIQFTPKTGKDLSDLAGKNVTIDFTATLGANARVGEPGNSNTFVLKYSNNPNSDTTGTSTEKKVYTFSYKIIVDKVDGNNDPLANAGFTLYKVTKAKAEAGATGTAQERNTYWATAANHISVVGAPAATTPTGGSVANRFTFNGLDDGYYVLCETTTPNGYNTINPQVFKVEATHDGADISTLTGTKLSGSDYTISFTSDTGAGSLSAQIQNQSGTVLPSTGGIGTTIFYILGGLLVVGAAVILVARRKASN